MSDQVRYEFTPYLAMHLLPWYKVRLKLQEAVSGVGLQDMVIASNWLVIIVT